MNIGIKSFNKYVIAIFVSSTLFALSSKANADEKSVNLLPVALEIFSHCLDVAYQGRQLSKEESYAEIWPKIETYAGLFVGTLEVEFEEDFGCFIFIPTGNYDPFEFRRNIELSQSSKFDGRTDQCGWRFNVRGRSVNQLECILRAQTEPANAFHVLAGISPPTGAFLRLRPVLIFDADGRIRLPK